MLDSTCGIGLPLLILAEFLAVVGLLRFAARGFATAIHELGHCFMAKVLGIRTPVLSFVPNNLPYRVIGNVLGTEVRIGRVFPVSRLGGYIGACLPNRAELAGAPIADRRRGRLFLLKLVLVSLAGPAVNVLTAIGVMLIVGERFTLLLQNNFAALCNAGVLWWFVTSLLMVTAHQNLLFECWEKDLTMAGDAWRELLRA